MMPDNSKAGLSDLSHTRSTAFRSAEIFQHSFAPSLRSLRLKKS